MEFIYYKLYKLAEKGKSYAPYYFTACALFSILIFFNILGIAILLKIFNIVNLFNLDISILLLFMIIPFILINLYFSYKSRYKSIIKKYDNIEYSWVKSLYFWLYAIISFFLPPLLLFFV
jgi:succinate dehydrogenase/fumarate reductase cytochrome b subunit